MELTFIVGGNPAYTVRFGVNTQPRIGRDPYVNDVVLHDPEVSRTHARLVRQGSGWMIKDFESKKGTFVNGRRVDGEAPVAPGDVLEIGEAVMSVEFRDHPTAVRPPEKTAHMTVSRCPNPDCRAMVMEGLAQCISCGAALT